MVARQLQDSLKTVPDDAPASDERAAVIAAEQQGGRLPKAYAEKHLIGALPQRGS